MRVRKLGIEWGATHEEAEPHVVNAGGDAFITFFTDEDGALIIHIPKHSNITLNASGGFQIRISNRVSGLP